MGELREEDGRVVSGASSEDLGLTRMRREIPSILTNTGATVLIRGAAGIARILLLLLIARKFGPADFGRLSLVLSFVELIRFAADLGVDTVLIRRFSVGDIPPEKLLGNSLILKAITATGGIFLSVALFGILYPGIEAMDLMLILSATFYTTLWLNGYLSRYQATLRMREMVLSSLFGAAVYIGLTLWGLVSDWPLVALCAVMPASELVQLALAHRIYRKTGRLAVSFDGKIIGGLLREGFPVAISNVMVVTYMRMDQLMLGWFIGAAAVGEYAAAYRLTEPLMLVFTSFSLSLYAAYSRGLENHQTRIRPEAYRVLRNTVVLAAMAALGVSFFSTAITGFLSEAYSNSAWALRILIWAIVFKAANAQLTAIINSMGRYRVITAVALTNLLINLSLNLLLIPVYGIIGAALAVLITEGINTLVQSAYLARWLKNGRSVEK